MDTVQFETQINRQIEMSRDLLISKNEEYSAEDRLHNFQIAASLQGVSMHHVLAGMMAKHTASIYDMLKDPVETHDGAKWDEKISDHINYLLILQAVLYEERLEGSDENVNDLIDKIDLNRNAHAFKREILPVDRYRRYTMPGKPNSL